MRFPSLLKLLSVVLALVMACPPAFGGQPGRPRVPQLTAPKPIVPKRVAKPKVAKRAPKPTAPKHPAKPKVVRPHPSAGPKLKPHPFVHVQPAHAYRRAYLPYGYHHSRSHYRRYGRHRVYRPYGRYGQTNKAFQKARIEMRRLQTVALLLNSVPRGSAADSNTVPSLQKALSALVTQGAKPSPTLVHSLATDLVSTLEARIRPLAEPMQLAYDLEAVLNAHVIMPNEVNMAVASANAVLRASGVPSTRLQAIDTDMRDVAQGSTGRARH